MPLDAYHDDAARVGSGQHLNVAISLLSHAPEMTGAATYARELVRALGQRTDLRLEVLCNEHAVKRLRGYVDATVQLRHLDGFRVGGSFASRGAALLGAALFPRRLTRQMKTAPAVVHYPLTVGIPRVSGPTVVTLHDTQHHDVRQQWALAGRAWRWLTYDRAARAATTVITDSDYARRRIVDVLEIPPDRVARIHLAVDHQRFTPTATAHDATLQARLGLPDRFVYYPAGLWPHKNHLRLIEAFAVMQDRRLGLVLTGASTPRLSEILDHARRLGVGDRVRHLGFVEDADLPALYRRAHAVVFPSLYEGFGLPPLEAMACGCPVASSRRASLAEICGSAAAILEPEDPQQMAESMAAVVDDAQLRADLRDRGLARAAQFSWDKVADAHLSVYSRAAASGQ